jgi:hypothetical protein
VPGARGRGPGGVGRGPWATGDAPLDRPTACLSCDRRSGQAPGLSGSSQKLDKVLRTGPATSQTLSPLVHQPDPADTATSRNIPHYPAPSCNRMPRSRRQGSPESFARIETCLRQCLQNRHIAGRYSRLRSPRRSGFSFVRPVGNCLRQRVSGAAGQRVSGVGAVSGISGPRCLTAVVPNGRGSIRPQVSIPTSHHFPYFHHFPYLVPILSSTTATHSLRLDPVDVVSYEDGWHCHWRADLLDAVWTLARTGASGDALRMLVDGRAGVTAGGRVVETCQAGCRACRAG